MAISDTKIAAATAVATPPGVAGCQVVEDLRNQIVVVETWSWLSIGSPTRPTITRIKNRREVLYLNDRTGEFGK